jgi:hypothetical protein
MMFAQITSGDSVAVTSAACVGERAPARVKAN